MGRSQVDLSRSQVDPRRSQVDLRQISVDFSSSQVDPSRSQPDPGAFPAVPSPDFSFAADEHLDVYVSAAESPGRFWVQLLGARSLQLDRLTAEMGHFYRSSAPVPPPSLQPGDIVAAPYLAGGEWCRARVLGPLDNGHLGLSYVDFGDSGEAPPEALRALRSDFLSLPFQAIECSLAGVVPSGERDTGTRLAPGVAPGGDTAVTSWGHGWHLLGTRMAPPGDTAGTCGGTRLSVTWGGGHGWHLGVAPLGGWHLGLSPPGVACGSVRRVGHSPVTSWGGTWVCHLLGGGTRPVPVSQLSPCPCVPMCHTAVPKCPQVAAGRSPAGVPVSLCPCVTQLSPCPQCPQVAAGRLQPCGSSCVPVSHSCPHVPVSLCHTAVPMSPGGGWPAPALQEFVRLSGCARWAPLRAQICSYGPAGPRLRLFGRRGHGQVCHCVTKCHQMSPVSPNVPMATDRCVTVSPMSPNVTKCHQCPHGMDRCVTNVPKCPHGHGQVCHQMSPVSPGVPNVPMAMDRCVPRCPQMSPGVPSVPTATDRCVPSVPNVTSVPMATDRC
uniref:Tudor domain-containing protein n=1 Tax=Taeniopygia guttata TaxID=59729 RepID=A0A674HUJ6_TAEGU